MCDLIDLFGDKLPATKRVKQKRSTSKNNLGMKQALSHTHTSYLPTHTHTHIHTHTYRRAVTVVVFPSGSERENAVSLSEPTLQGAGGYWEGCPANLWHWETNNACNEEKREGYPAEHWVTAEAVSLYIMVVLNHELSCTCFFRVDRIRTLNASFHQHLGKLEESQNNEQLSVRRSLKQEMHSLQKKLLVDYVSRSSLLMSNANVLTHPHTHTHTHTHTRRRKKYHGSSSPYMLCYFKYPDNNV